ncbi:GAF domain-containing protein, partial [Mucilaginibacter endophyticus]|uniref:GAF domain-containing protein n=1 Tax=Mucilaginibacter endophyticus TaxID=2675003 RepID=UPI000E0CE23E
ASQAAVHELRRITGFDGIMMYRFDEDWNGTVIAEEKDAPELEHYLGHTFPGSDVPRQARDLYLKNSYRLIPDRDFTPVRLYPVMNPVTNTFIDLSDCNLRGVAAVHLEYLKNMNVQASMSIRVIDNGKLWGLIACHHVRPHYLSFETGAVCEMLSSVISNR